MASALAQTIALDTALSFEINPGTLLQFLETRAEGGPRLKCFEGSVTLVSAGMSHGIMESRVDSLILAACLEFRIKYSGLGSTTWNLPLGAGDTAYEADAAYSIPSFGQMKEHQPPDLAIEIVVSHSEKKGSVGRGLPQDSRVVGPRHPPASADVPPTGDKRQAQGYVPTCLPKPGVPRPDVRRSPGTARRPGDRCRRLPRKLPRLGQAGPRASPPSGKRRGLILGKSRPSGRALIFPLPVELRRRGRPGAGRSR